ncbi:MAG: hypothetical protein DCC67_19530 [Planctomycetota bacterium]|nr:MAG: hypothetical protein DCC67_19530 [Planctomycetota bacterium]
MPNAIVVAVDGLRAAALGAYGNAWHPTPSLDELASRSLLMDWMWCPGPDVLSFYDRCWRHLDCAGHAESLAAVDASRSSHGLHDCQQRPSLAATLGEAAVETTCLTDAPEIAELAERAGFAEIYGLDAPAAKPASSWGDTELARLFSAAVDRLQPWSRTRGDGDRSPPRLLWLHARGFHGAWDAPVELRQRLHEEGDPPAATFLHPPAALRTDDQDEALPYRAAYAAQTMVLDECLGGLLAAIDELALADHTLVMLVGCRGFALGEHGGVGSGVRDLYSELLHIPCVMWAPGILPSPQRSPLLVGAEAVAAALLRWFAVDGAFGEEGPSLFEGGAAPPCREGSPWLLACGDGGERAMRTPAWMLRQPPRAADVGAASVPAPMAELYVKPDDRWEANEVADRCPDIVARLLALLDEGILVDSGGAVRVAELDADLTTPIR